ncbi:MAG: 30S ribosomal protein S1 [Solirubrobacterales bacterium]
MSTTITEIQPNTGTEVPGSDGLLLEVDGKIVPNYAATLIAFEDGDVVQGEVVRIDRDEVLVDIGYKSEGVIPVHELSIRKNVNPEDEVSLGEMVDALVVTKEDADGRLVLSKKRAKFEKAWRKIEGASESGEPVEGIVIEVVKGGLIVDLGIRGFLPASLVDIRRVQDLDEFKGTTVRCKVIELNRSRNNVVLSRRAILEEERKEVRQQIIDNLERGSVVEGAISNIVDFGAFVDLDGIDGLIHISELSWSHVNHPSEVVSIGDVVSVKVLDIDHDRQRISLGLKQTQEDPWQKVIDTHHIGDVLEGSVTKIVSFGAFVEIYNGVEGLVHISELSEQHVENPRQVLNEGDTVRVRILEIDTERRRLSLSAKQVEGQTLVPTELPGSEGSSEASGDESAESTDDGSADTAAVDVGDEVAESAPEATDALASEDEAPAAETAEEAPADAPSDEVAAEEVADAPAEEAPAEEAAAEEAPAEEAPAEADVAAEADAATEADAAEDAEAEDAEPAVVDAETTA